MSMFDVLGLNKGQKQLLLIIFLFTIPPVAAYFSWDYVRVSGVGATTNSGDLIAPVKPLDVSGLSQVSGEAVERTVVAGKWTFVMIAKGECAEVCQRQLYLTRQYRTSMSKDITRVQRLLVMTEQPSAEFTAMLKEQHPHLNTVVLVTDDASKAFLSNFDGEGYSSDGAQYFLVDPLSNLMMRYNTEHPYKGVLKDLRRLLKASQVG